MAFEAWGVQSSAPTSGTTKDIQHGSITTTPKAAIHIVARPTTINSSTNHGAFGIGITDGISEFWVGISAQHGLAGSSNVNKARSASGGYGRTFSSSHITDGEMSHNSWLAGGQRLNIDNAFAEASISGSLFFNADNVKAMSGNLPNTVDTALNLDPGFAWDCAIVVGIAQSGSVNEADAEFFLGFYDKTNQGCFIYSGEDATTPSDSGAYISNNRVAGRITPPGDTVLDYSVEASVGSGTSLDLTVRGDGGNLDTVQVLFLAGVDAKVLFWDSPTANGNQAITGAGFQPTFSFNIFSFLSAYNSGQSDADAGSFGFGYNCTGEQFCASHQDEYGSATTDTQGQAYNQSIYVDKDNGSVGYDADFVSFDSDGFTHNWVANEGTTNKFISLVLKEKAAGTPKSASDSGALAANAELDIDTLAWIVYDVGNFAAIEDVAIIDTLNFKTDLGNLSVTETASILKNPEFVSGTIDTGGALTSIESASVATGTGTVKSSTDSASTISATESSSVVQLGASVSKSATEAGDIASVKYKNLVLHSEDLASPGWSEQELGLVQDFFGFYKTLSGGDADLLFRTAAATSEAYRKRAITLENANEVHVAYVVLDEYGQDNNTDQWGALGVEGFGALDLRVYFKCSMNANGQATFSLGQVGADVIDAFVITDWDRSVNRIYSLIGFTFNPGADLTGDIALHMTEGDGSLAVTAASDGDSFLIGGLQVYRGTEIQPYIRSQTTVAEAPLDTVAQLKQIDQFKSASDSANLSATENTVLIKPVTVSLYRTDSGRFSGFEIGTRTQYRSGVDEGFLTVVETSDIVEVNYDPSWEDDDVVWGGLLLQSKDLAPIFPVGQNFYILGQGQIAPLDALFERKAVVFEKGLAVLGRTVYPQIIGPFGEKILISLGGHQTPDGAIDWEGPYEFTIGEDISVDFAVAGRYLAIRFESQTVSSWRLPSFEIDYEVVGVY